MITKEEKIFKHLKYINEHIQYVWRNIPSSVPDGMENIKTAHDIWDWCDESNLNVEDFERNVYLKIIIELSKIFPLEMKIENGNFTIISIKESISFNSTFLITSLSELIKKSELTKDSSFDFENAYQK